MSQAVLGHSFVFQRDSVYGQGESQRSAVGNPQIACYKLPKAQKSERDRQAQLQSQSLDRSTGINPTMRCQRSLDRSTVKRHAWKNYRRHHMQTLDLFFINVTTTSDERACERLRKEVQNKVDLMVDPKMKILDES
mmetsp:Transcript_36822/g.59580  ORF Transcript_36822/g.59580 Transcript_36822/m.59580 type:complete len:136 (-) Transcript_36822:2788-3195(-)